MTDEPRAPEPPGELWGLWRPRLGWAFASYSDRLSIYFAAIRNFRSREEALEAARQYPGECVPALLGVHPDWRRRALAAEKRLGEIGAEIRMRADLTPEDWDDHLDGIAEAIHAHLAPAAGLGG